MRPAAITYADARRAVTEHESAAAAARSLGVARSTVLRALKRGPAEVVPVDELPTPLGSAPRIVLASSRAHLLAAQAAAAHRALRRGDAAAADRSLAAVTRGLRLLASAHDVD